MSLLWSGNRFLSNDIRWGLAEPRALSMEPNATGTAFVDECAPGRRRIRSTMDQSAHFRTQRRLDYR
jgi:hypothetical protein